MATRSHVYLSFLQTGDEMSKRAKFVFVTWVGPSVSVMKKAKMSTDKALMKDIIQVISCQHAFFIGSKLPQNITKNDIAGCAMF